MFQLKSFLQQRTTLFNHLSTTMPLFAPTSFAPAVTPITSYPLTPLLERKISLLSRSSKPVPASLLAALEESRKTARALIFKSRADHFNNMLTSVKPNSKVFGKLPTPSYIDLLLLRHSALQKLSIL